MATWFESLASPRIKVKQVSSKTPEGLWTKCAKCSEILYRIEIERNFNTCPHCRYHFSISPRRWIELVLDEGSFQESDADLVSRDPLLFKDVKPYKVRIKEAMKRSGECEAFVYGRGAISGSPVVFGVFSFEFMGGSMGTVVGEKVASGFELSLKMRTPIILVSMSGGARMQEGMLSLMQMAKTCMVRARLAEAGVPFISVLAHPTTGGVAASFAMLGDIMLAEPGALIGFAGPRVIEQTIKGKLPENFQRASYLFENGMMDQIVHRAELKGVLTKLLRLFSKSPVGDRFSQ